MAPLAELAPSVHGSRPAARWFSASDSAAAVVVPILGGAALAFGFRATATHWLIWIGLVPIAAALARRDHWALSAIGMYLAGLVFNLVTTDWIRTLEGGSGLSGRSAPDWLLQSQLLALFWPVMFAIGRILVFRMRLPMSLALPATWTIHELLLRMVWKFVDSTGWLVYHLGYAVIDDYYISQVADLGGVSLLSFLAACSSGAVWDLIAIYRARRLGIRPACQFLWAPAAAVGLLLASYVYGRWAVSESNTTNGPVVWLIPASALDAAPPGSLRDTNPSQSPDVLLGPELAYFGPTPIADQAAAKKLPSAVDQEPEADAPFDPLTLQNSLAEVVRRIDVPLVVGYTRVEPAEVKRKYNSVAFVLPTEGFVGYYDKIGLVPWTEFTPRQGLAASKGRQFTHGNRHPVFELPIRHSERRSRFASAICYDVAFADVFRRYMQDAAGAPEFFLVCSSERSDTTGLMSRHMLSMAKARAIENRRTIVRHVSSGHSGRIDSTGRLLDQELPRTVRSLAPLGVVPIDSRRTFFARMGDWIPTAVLGSLALLACVQIVRRRHGLNRAG